MTALGRVTLLCLSQSRKQADLLPELSRWQRLLLDVIRSPNGVAALAAVVRYILHTSETKPQGLQDLFRKLGPKVEEAYMTGAQILTQQARAEGEAKGKAEGKAELVIKQLELKFGSLSAEQAAHIRTASLDDLDRFAERVVTATSLDQVFAD